MTIPNLLTPFFSVEVDNSGANQNAAEIQYKALIIGQKTSAGSATANSIILATGSEQAVPLVGRGSLAHREAMAWFSENESIETHIGVLADDGAGVAATGTIEVAGPATEAGSFVLLIGGERATVAVADDDTADEIAASIDAAIDALTNAPVTSSATTDTVTLTARNKGVCGNDIDIRLTDDSVLPAGVSLTITAMASGATNPSLTALIAAMGDTQYHVIVLPYTDTTSLTAIETEMADRAGPTRQIPGLVITSKRGDVSTVTALTASRNSPHVFFATQPFTTPITPAYEAAAVVASAAAEELQADPALPLQTVAVPWIQAPKDSFNRASRNTLLSNGAGTLKLAPGGLVEIERLVSTYRLNSAGSADPSYRDITTLATLMYLRFSFLAMATQEWGRAKLADDGVRFQPGAGKIITPKLAKARIVSWFRQMSEEKGLVENPEQFKAQLTVTRDASNRNRLNCYLPTDLVNFLAELAATLGFIV